MSDELTVDLSNYKDRVGQRVIPGRYTVIVDDVEVDKASTGNDMINVWLRIVGGEFDGAVIVDRLVQTERALFRTVNFMQSIGLQTPKKRLRINVRQWVGKSLEIDVEDGDPYMGKVKSEVRGYFQSEKKGGKADLDAPAEEASGEGLEEFASTEAPEDVDLDKLDLG